MLYLPSAQVEYHKSLLMVPAQYESAGNFSHLCSRHIVGLGCAACGLVNPNFIGCADEAEM